MPDRRRAGRLGLAALGALGLWTLLLLQLPLFFGPFPRHPRVIDFANYVTAARVGLRYGWSRIYDPALQAPVYLAVSGARRFEWHQTFVSPPPVAWLTAPLAGLPVDVAYWTWTFLAAVLLGFACWRVNPWRGLAGAVALVVGFGLYPVLIALQFGQVTPFIAAGVAFAWWYLKQDRQDAAALLLLPVVLKPQVAVLVPLALGLAGYRRCLLVWLAGAAAVGAASLLSLGPSGVAQYASDLGSVQSHLDNQVWTLASFLGPGPLATAAEVGCVLLALVAGWSARGRGPTVPLVAGALGSLLGTGYHHSIDFPSLLPLGLIQLGELSPRARAVLCVGGVVACYATPRLGPLPLLAVCSAWLLLLAVGSLREARTVNPAQTGRDVWDTAVPSRPG
jgi:Glycosyltransferase family 87